MLSYNQQAPQILDQYGRPYRQRPDGSAQVSGISLPHAWTFVARDGGAFNTYWMERYDEALRKSRDDAEVMRRDTYLMALLQERTLAVSGLPWHLEVPDPRDHNQRRVRDGLTQVIKGIPNLRRIINWLLGALWYGRYGVQVEWSWGSFRDTPSPGAPAVSGPLDALVGKQKTPASGQTARCLTVRQAWPVNGDKIGFQYDHTPYVMVNAAEDDNLPNADTISTTLGRALALRGSWRERFILHKHLMEDADYFASDQGGGVHGVGIRSKLFWLNWLKLEWLSNITDFFDRVGMGFMVWKYPAGNDAAKTEAEAAARNQSSRAHVLVPVWGESGREALTGVERVDIATAGSEALVKLIEYVDNQLERYVVGQSGSARSSSSGIGNEAASQFLRATKTAITMDDAHLLGVSLTGTLTEPALVNTIQRYTYPWADFPVNFVFDVERPESEQKLNAGKVLVEMGVKVKEDEFRQAAGYGAPADGDKVVEPPAPPGTAPGMPGMPGPPGGGEPGAEAGGALGGAEPGGAEPGAEAGGAEPGAEAGGGQQPAGDFLQALQMARGETPLRYDWQNKGVVRVSATGLPLYRWYDPERREARIQNVMPGGRRGAARERKAGPHSSGKLDVGRVTRRKIAQALALMFPGGWLRQSGLPALAGVEGDEPLAADVSRGPDGSLVIALRAAGGRHELALHPDGLLSMRLPSRERLKLSRRALTVAGVDIALLADGAGEDLTEDEDVPESVAEGNAARRSYRVENADEQMDAADDIVPYDGDVEGGDEPEKEESGDGPERHSRHAAMAQAVEYLKASGRGEAAREAVIAYARRLAGG